MDSNEPKGPGPQVEARSAPLDIEDTPREILKFTIEERLFNEGADALTFDEQLDLFVRASQKKKDADAESREAKKIIDALQESLVDEFIDRSITSMRKNDLTI